MTSAMSLFGRVGVAETASGAQSGSSASSVAMPGTTPRRSASRASTASIVPAAAIRCPNAHLNAVTGGIAAPNTRRSAAASELSDSLVPLP